MFHKFGKQVNGGVQVHITDRHVFRPYATYVALMALAHHQAPERFAFRTEPYEFVADIPAFDLLTGDDEARLSIERGENARDIAEAAATTGGRRKACRPGSARGAHAFCAPMKNEIHVLAVLLGLAACARPPANAESRRTRRDPVRL